METRYARPAPGTEMPVLSWQDLRDHVNAQTCDPRLVVQTRRGRIRTTTRAETRERRCWKCQEWKSFEEFSRCRHDFFGIARKCRICNRISSTEQYQQLRGLANAAKAAGLEPIP